MNQTLSMDWGLMLSMDKQFYRESDIHQYLDEWQNSMVGSNFAWGNVVQ